MMSKTNEIINKLETLTNFIEEAQIKLQQGEIINLSHLDGEVAELCNEILQLPPQDATQVQPIMGNMISKLEELGLALKDFQSNLKNKNA
jgi:hypothetical protein